MKRDWHSDEGTATEQLRARADMEGDYVELTGCLNGDVGGREFGVCGGMLAQRRWSRSF
jgi:hypothetical protein